MKFIFAAIFITLLSFSAYSQALSDKDFLYIGSTEKGDHDYFLITPTIEKQTPIVSFLYIDAVDKDTYTVYGAIINCRDMTEEELMAMGRDKGVKFQSENPKPEFEIIKPDTIGAALYKHVCSSDELP